ncbi:MAG: sulfatase-like hydrolase/transferase [Bacilli bacterium]|nr:sulfatase-like hydrolase/transferase [Bacilli bacterium]
MEKKKKQIKKKKTNTTKKKTTTQKKKTTSTNKNIPKKEVKKINKEAPKVVKTEIKEIPKVIIPEVKENKLDKYNKIIISLINILYLELIYQLCVFKTFEFKSILFITLFSLLTSLFIDLITSFFNKKLNKWLFIGINAFIYVLFLAQYINFKFYGNIISVYSVFHGGQVFGFFGAIWAVIKENIFRCLLLFIPVSLLFIFHKKIKSESFNPKILWKKALVLLITFIITVLSLNLDTKKSIYTAKNLYYNQHYPNQMAQTFGILTTMRLDLERTISGFEEKTIEVAETPDKEVNKNPKIEYNVADIDYDSLIKNETNEEIKNIHNYVKSSTPSEKNIYTGMFKGKNLIAIVAEAFSPIAVNKDLTPTLYKLVNSGFVFNNFYTPVYYVSTSDGEYVTLNSLLPKESVWSFSKSSKNYLPYAYGNLFKEMGYTTYAFHDGTYKYYNRHLSHPNMGYTYKACGNGLEKSMKCKIWPQSDLEMINATYDYYKDSEHFMTYYMTISGHLQYNFYGNNMSYRNRELVKDLDKSTAIKAYIAAQKELDKALEELLNKLEADGKLDDTVIVLSADHYPYGLTTDQISEVMNIEDSKFDVHKNNLVIWSSTMKEPIEINKYGESLDILPTVLNLFGIDFDSRLLMGRDLLSNSDGLVIFNDRSWITDKGKYNASTKVFTPFNNEQVDEDYIESINTKVYNKFVISKNILETNYYKYVFNK